MLIVMMYHYIHGENDSKVFNNLKGITIEEFEKQILFLLTKFTPITHIDLENYFKQNKPLPDNSFYLTFDDGFKQHLTNALPILKKYNLEGSFFIPTMPLKEQKLHFLEKQRICQYSIETDYNKFLEQFYYYTKPHISNKKLDQINPSMQNLEKTQDYLSKYKFYSKEERFYRYIRDNILNKTEIEFIINDIFNNSFKEKEFIYNYYLNKKDLSLLNDNNMIIGGHSHSHPFLEKLSREEIKEEIVKSFDLLKYFIKKDITTFSYPYGTYNKNVIAELENNNIVYSFTTKDEINVSKLYPYEITRIDAASFDKVINL